MQQSHEQYVNCQYAKDYQLQFQIGDGGQANVYLGTKEYKIYALKVYNHGFNKEQGFKREVDFLNNLKFPYLISIIEADAEAEVKLKGQKPQKRLLIVLEFAQAEMFEFIYKQGRFDPEICRTLFRQLIMALKFLNDKGITHRDLKPENLLFDQDFNLKVSDFGMSTFTEGYNKDNKLYSKVGTQGYQCPQIQQGKKYQGLHADLFAAGVILFVMYSGSPPFASTKPIDKIYKCIKDRQFNKFWAVHEKRKPVGFYPDSFKRLINQFFSYDPIKRPTFKDLEADEWLNGQIAMGNELKQYMKKKYDKIAETDVTKQKIAQIRKKLLEKQLQDSQNSKDESNRSGQSMIFVDRLREFNQIKLEQLEQTDRKVTYFIKDIGFTLAFLKDFIEECQNSKVAFMSDFVQDIQPTQFKMEVYKDQVQLTFAFQIDQQSEEVLKVNGKLYRQDKKVGIQWIKKQGNDFWLSCIIHQLNQRLKVLV